MSCLWRRAATSTTTQRLRAVICRRRMPRSKRRCATSCEPRTEAPCVYKMRKGIVKPVFAQINVGAVFAASVSVANRMSPRAETGVRGQQHAGAVQIRLGWKRYKTGRSGRFCPYSEPKARYKPPTASGLCHSSKNCPASPEKTRAKTLSLTGSKTHFKIY